VFIASYPKSGTTLLQMLLYQLTTEGEMTFEHILDVQSMFDEDVFIRPEYLDRMPSPRVLKSHAPKPGDLPGGSKKVYIFRSPADVALSLFNHKRLYGQRHEIAAFIDQFVGAPIEESWFGHVECWLGPRDDPNILVLRYESVIADVGSAARQVASFCGIELSGAKLGRIVERCDFKFMKKYTKKFDPRLWGPHPFNSAEAAAAPGNNETDFINRGEAGLGISLFSPAQRRLLDRRLADLALKLNISSAPDVVRAIFT
jgi:hypothetical protein